MEINVWIQDGHGGRLEEKHQLYTNQMSHSEVLEYPGEDGHQAAKAAEACSNINILPRDQIMAL